ncbi:hypothetical protein Pla108_31900 [Botrimarina colliarenosi]|uniref:Cell division protein FtsQ n=1 Tax=Botrimarina colliarenosi TaxID=2528001 RepID=A0A5C6A9W3_9BACT|nr:hypothetical protein [Botrimarina colliarenosi]TWT96108.1 hypothetical protein Pla108_31900 [Botrimarina colliarenosi]
MSAPSPNPPRDIAGWLSETIRARRGVLLSLAILAALGLATRGAWLAVRPQVAHSPQYLLTPASVSVTAPPAWVRGDVTADVFRVGGLDGQLSVLDPPAGLEERLAQTFVTHPWVRSVGAITKTPPNRVTLELEYRTPLAAVELGGALLPVDLDGALLPTRDLSADAVRYLPRIELTDATVRPPAVGELWLEPRLAGALALVGSFGSAWSELDLFLVRIDHTPGVRAGQRFWSYNVVSTGNTVVVWGGAPGFSPPDEAPFAKKLGNLRRAIAKHGPLDSVAKSPAMIDVRDGDAAYPRVVKKEGNRVASKDDDETATK